MIRQLEYRIFDNLEELNLWLMKSPTAEVINVETMPDKRLKLWCRYLLAKF